MFYAKFFALSVVCLVVLQLAQFIECGEKGDTIILGHHCGPKFLLNEGKKGKGSTLVMGGNDCHKKKEEHHHHYEHHYEPHYEEKHYKPHYEEKHYEPHYEEKHEEHYGYEHGYDGGM
ncbi:hypothetical protein RDWZM_007107 [Blomia tropicalis]|uniref:Uncharacterized protein n=1 Tax=Blomia tropicalis TaxID=40697 RepID=A0A9Q0M8U0_BLOTA|nr:hypothetical protein BLOT_016346 [Blomia tropicalis]KAJ6221295.1 hypothetical protein RDWZM_007107 [Blomia tropicalis]